MKIFQKSETSAFNFFEKQSSNILEYIDNLEQIDISKEEKILNINEISDTFITIGRGSEYINKIESLRLNLCDDDDNKLVILFDMIKLILRYMNGDFDNSYNKFMSLISIDEILKLNFSNAIDIAISETSAVFYLNDGRANEAVKIISNFTDMSYTNYINVANFYLGEFEKIRKNKTNKKFFDFEYDFIINKINMEELGSYIDNIYSKDYLELMQCNYIKAKMGTLCKNEIEKLVVTNPYTKGIKLLMKAMLNNKGDSCNLYEEAIENLKHIKYYYTEAIYYYSKYLKDTNVDEYKRWFELVYSNAKKYSFRYVIHLFVCLRDEIDIKYDEKNKVIQ